MFKCKVCAEKDQRIADLKNQVAFLRAQVSVDNSPDNTPILHFEADGVLSAQQHVLEIPSAQQLEERAADQERSERDRILSGTY